MRLVAKKIIDFIRVGYDFFGSELDSQAVERLYCIGLVDTGHGLSLHGFLRLLGLLQLRHGVEVQVQVLAQTERSLEAFFVQPEDFDGAVTHSAGHQILGFAESRAIYLLVRVQQVD